MARSKSEQATYDSRAAGASMSRSHDRGKDFTRADVRERDKAATAADLKAAGR